MFNIFLLVSVLVLVVNGLPEIVYITRSTIINPGHNVELTCHLLNIESYDIGWVKTNRNGKLDRISSNDVQQLADPRFSLNSYEEETTNFEKLMIYSLKITNVSAHDNGTYECMIYVNKSMMLYNSTSLLIFPKDTKNEIVLLGDNAHLECFSRDWNFNNVVWTKYYKDSLPDGSRVSDGVLTIHSTLLEDSGLYMCRAEFYFDRMLLDATRNIKLEIIVPLDVKVRNAKLNRPTGYDVNLTCLIHSMTEFTVSWTKENEPIYRDINHDFHVYEVDLSSGSFKKSLKIAELKINKIKEEDYGYYSCIVENDFGIKSGSINLKQFV